MRRRPRRSARPGGCRSPGNATGRARVVDDEQTSIEPVGNQQPTREEPHLPVRCPGRRRCSDGELREATRSPRTPAMQMEPALANVSVPGCRGAFPDRSGSHEAASVVAVAGRRRRRDRVAGRRIGTPSSERCPQQEAWSSHHRTARREREQHARNGTVRKRGMLASARNVGDARIVSRPVECHVNDRSGCRIRGASGAQSLGRASSHRYSRGVIAAVVDLLARSRPT